jgi:ParB family chromosome partitioning protein
MAEENMKPIELDKINIGKWNVRTLDREKGIDELVESIQKYGLLQPIVVFQEGDKFDLIIGQRRLRAFKELKKKDPLKFNKISAIVLPQKLEDEQLKILSLSENIHRVELNREDIVEVISYLYNRHNKSAKNVAKLLGISIPTVYNYLKIADAPKEVREILSKGGRIINADVKRVMELAPDSKEEMIKLAHEFKKLTPQEKVRAVEIKRRKPEIKPEDAMKESKKPFIEEKLIVPLSPALIMALDTAVKEIGLSREEIAKKALEEWLENKGYYR